MSFRDNFSNRLITTRNRAAATPDFSRRQSSPCPRWLGYSSLLLLRRCSCRTHRGRKSGRTSASHGLGTSTLCRVIRSRRCWFVVRAFWAIPSFSGNTSRPEKLPKLSIFIPQFVVGSSSPVFASCPFSSHAFALPEKPFWHTMGWR